MSITIVDASRFVAYLTFKRDDGSNYTIDLSVTAFDEDGAPLVACERGLVSPEDWSRRGGRLQYWYLEEFRRTVIPAQPGWMVDIWDELGECHSMPVIAWIHEPDNSGDPAGTAIYVQAGNRGGNVSIDEIDLTKTDVQVRLASESVEAPPA